MSAVALVALMPVSLVLALVVRLDSRGPVFYRQERIGYHKKPLPSKLFYLDEGRSI